MNIGDLAEKYEVGNRGPGYISNGDKWDPGGDSYGSYQLATKTGTLTGYLKTNLLYVSNLNRYVAKSKEFDTLWRNIAQNDPEGFKQSQFDYVKTISYEPCRKYATKMGMADTFAINSALFSISNQHGGWKKILNAAGVHKDEVKQINALYDARKNYIQGLSTLSATLKKNIIKQRCVLERADCLKLVGKPMVPVVEGKNIKSVGIFLTLINWFKEKK